MLGRRSVLLWESFHSASHLALQADAEHEQWMDVGSDVHTVSTGQAELEAWVRSTRVEEIARLLGGTPHGLAAHPTSGRSIQFTPWQRLAMCHYVHQFTSVTTSVHVDSETLIRVARYRDGERVGRREPIFVQRSLRKGTCRDVGLVNLATASGKTSFALSVGLMTLLKVPELKQEYLAKTAGSVFHGPPEDVKMPRLLLVACPPSTFDHFVCTAQRLLPPFMLMAPEWKVHVWTTVGKRTSIQLAEQCTSSGKDAVVWIVPSGKLGAVLKDAPGSVVPMCIVDEFTSDSAPRIRSQTDRAVVFKQMVLQATLHELVNATRGYNSALKELFGGELMPPSSITAHISHRDYKHACVAAGQYCLMDVLSMNPFRHYIREDLTQFMPAGLLMTQVKSKRFTLASHLEGCAADMVPASLLNILLSSLKRICITQESRQLLEKTCEDVNCTASALKEALSKVTTRVPVPEGDSTLQRLQERVEEFMQSCPICLTEEPQGMKLCGSCGYCVCQVCFQASPSKCAFCRTVFPASLHAEDVAKDPAEYVAEQEARMQEEQDALYPQQGASPFHPPDLFHNRQITNLVLCLHEAVARGCTRIILVVETSSLTSPQGGVISWSTVSTVTGITIDRVDSTLVGKGKDFTQIKALYDSPDPRPRALLSFGSRGLLIGTDLGRTDCLVIVGRIPERVKTQAMGRIFRPVPGRRPGMVVQGFQVCCHA